MELEPEDVEGDGNESSEWEEYTDSSEGEVDAGPRLKPVFVPRKDRVTIQEKELVEQRLKELEFVDKRNAENRRRETLKVGGGGVVPIVGGIELMGSVAGVMYRWYRWWGCFGGAPTHPRPSNGTADEGERV